ENNPSIDVASGEGWYGDEKNGGAIEDAPPDGGYADASADSATVSGAVVPTDAAPMDMPQDKNFDQMFEQMFGEHGEISGAVKPERPAARPDRRAEAGTN